MWNGYQLISTETGVHSYPGMLPYQANDVLTLVGLPSTRPCPAVVVNPNFVQFEHYILSECLDYLAFVKSKQEAFLGEVTLSGTW